MRRIAFVGLILANCGVGPTEPLPVGGPGEPPPVRPEMAPPARGLDVPVLASPIEDAVVLRGESPADCPFDVVVRTRTELDAIAHCRSIGRLTLHPTDYDAAVLPALVRADRVRASGAMLRRLELPALEAVHTLEITYGRDLEHLAAPSLVEATAIFVHGTVTTTVTFERLSRVQALSMSANQQLAQLALPSLTEAEVSLRLSQNPALSELSLPRLTRIQRVVLDTVGVETLALPELTELSQLQVNRAPALAAITIPQVTHVTGSVRLSGVPVLATLDLPQVEHIDEALQIEFSEHLEELDGLSALVSVSDLELVVLAGLRSLDGLAALERVDGELKIRLSHTLEQVHLPALTQVGHLHLSGLAAARSLSWPALSAAGAITVHQLSALERLDLSPVDTAGVITIRENRNLTDVDSGSVRRASAIHILGNDAIGAVRGGRLTEVRGELSLRDNPNVRAFCFGSLERVGDRLSIRDNASLTQVSLPALARTSLYGTSVMNNEALRSLVLPALTGGNFAVRDNPALEVLRLPAMTSGTHITISANPELSTLDLEGLTDTYALGLSGSAIGELVLPNLESVATSIAIDDNPDLHSMELEALASVGHELRIEGNTSLSHCAVDALAQRLRDAGAVGGAITTGNNGGTAPCP